MTGWWGVLKWYRVSLNSDPLLDTRKYRCQAQVTLIWWPRIFKDRTEVIIIESFECCSLKWVGCSFIPPLLCTSTIAPLSSAPGSDHTRDYSGPGRSSIVMSNENSSCIGHVTESSGTSVFDWFADLQTVLCLAGSPLIFLMSFLRLLFDVNT